MPVVVCWKWTGEDPRWAGVSAADEAALEVGLRLAGDDDLTLVSVGAASADHGLRAGLATGATRAVRIDGPADLSSAAVAAAIAPLAADATWVVTGDMSNDRGSGAVPAFLAAELGAAQALGAVAVATVPAGRLRVTRRLDGGRREILDVEPPAVVSVEGAVAALRRASLPAELAARTAPIDVLAGPSGPVDRAERILTYRPRARALAAPQGDALERVRELTAVGAATTASEIVTAAPAEAATRILATLRAWGYLA